MTFSTVFGGHVGAVRDGYGRGGIGYGIGVSIMVMMRAVLNAEEAKAIAVDVLSSILTYDSTYV
jgi:hypothetical protein